MAKNATKFLQVVTIGRVLHFHLGNGLKLEFDVDRPVDAVRDMAMIKGFEAKIRDGAANCSETSDYSGAFSKMTEIIDALNGGVWNRKGSGGVSDAAQALANMKGVDILKAMEIIRGLNEETREKLYGSKVFKEEIVKIQTARKAAQIAAMDAENDDLSFLDELIEG